MLRTMARLFAVFAFAAMAGGMVLLHGAIRAGDDPPGLAEAAAGGCAGRVVPRRQSAGLHPARAGALRDGDTILGGCAAQGRTEWSEARLLAGLMALVLALGLGVVAADLSSRARREPLLRRIARPGRSRG